MTHSKEPAIDAEVLLEHEAWIRRLARGMVRDSHDVDDVIQQTWLNALLWPPRRGGDLRGWLATVVRNVVRQRHRGEGKARQRAEAGARSESDVSSVDVTERLEWQRKLADAVIALRSIDREVLVLRYYDDLTPQEIARTLALPPHTVKSRLARAKARLRTRLEASWEEGGEGRSWRTALCMVAFGTTAAPHLASVGAGATGGSVNWLVIGTAGMVVGAVVLLSLPEQERMSEGAQPVELVTSHTRADSVEVNVSGLEPLAPREPQSITVKPRPPVAAQEPQQAPQTGDNLLGAEPVLPADPSPEERMRAIFAPLLEPSSITVSVRYTGAPAQVRTIDASTDPVCEGEHADGWSRPDFLVDERGMLADVVVSLKGIPLERREPPKKPLVLDQRGCAYEPRVFAVMTRQEIELKNSDETLHNVHAMPKVNKEFNLAMPMVDMTVRKHFKKAESAFAIRCDVHPWMTAWCTVFDHPYFAVTDAKGRATMSTQGLEDGSYTVELWHPVLGTGTTEVLVVGGRGAEPFEFGESQER